MDVGASVVKEKAGSTGEPVVTGETVVVEVDGATGTIVAVGVAAAEPSPATEVLTQSPTAAGLAGPYVMACRTAPFGSTSQGPGFEEALTQLARAHQAST